MPKQISEELRQADRETLRALKKLPGYVAVNPAHSKEKLIATEADLTRLEEIEQHTRSTYLAARAAALTVANKFHNDIVGVRLQVAAQYGRDSQEVQDVGYKKLSDRKRPARRAKSASVVDV